MPRRHLARRLLVTLALLSGQAALAAAPACADHAAAVQILGSGGPEAGLRAGPAYLLWVDGRARLLIDAGPGARLRLAESGGQLTDIDAVLLTHLHADHANDLPALVKAAYFTPRSADLAILGPTGNGAMPGTRRWLATLFGKNGYRYLAGHLPDDHGEDFKLHGRDIDAANRQRREVWRAGDLVVYAAGVHHGPIPALAYRIEGPGFVLAISGDSSGSGPSQQALEDIASQATLFIAHHAVPEDAGPAALNLHMPPGQIGRIAGAAGVQQLVLSHRMQRTLGRESESTTAIRRHYPGPLQFAEDLDCLPLQSATATKARRPG